MSRDDLLAFAIAEATRAVIEARIKLDEKQATLKQLLDQARKQGCQAVPEAARLI